MITRSAVQPFLQQLVPDYTNKNINVRHHWPFVVETDSDRWWFPLTKGQYNVENISMSWRHHNVYSETITKIKRWTNKRNTTAGPYYWYVVYMICVIVRMLTASRQDLRASFIHQWVGMMTSSNGNIFRVTGHLCEEFTGSRGFPAQRSVTRSFDVFFIWINGWVNNREAGDLSHYRPHYDAIVMVSISHIIYPQQVDQNPAPGQVEWCARLSSICVIKCLPSVRKIQRPDYVKRISFMMVLALLVIPHCPK